MREERREVGERPRFDEEGEFRFIVGVLHRGARYRFDFWDLNFARVGVGGLEDIRRAE